MLILIADDEAGIQNTLRELLQADHEVILCSDGATALAALEKTAVDLVITDNQMPKLTGLELIREGKELSPATSFILMSAYGSVDQAVEAIRVGADDYFLKPFELEEIEHRVRRIEELRSWRVEKAMKVEAGRGASRLIGDSKAMREIKEFISKVAPAGAPVLLLGPSGSGKEVVAKAIHESGPRGDRPFIAINCASLSEQLMESELFGHEKGAFTGATASKPGKFELAKGGTLFLDEVGELPPGLQAKLLRVLQEKEFCRVGGVRQIKSDARVITATHRPLKEMVKNGQFREDLFFRLNVLAYELPGLRERKDDIPPLVEFFWSKFTREMGSHAKLAPETLAVLGGYAYPGNIRELQNVLERLVVLSGSDAIVRPSALPPEFRGPAESGSAAAPPGEIDFSASLTAQVDALEERLVTEAMHRCDQNQVRAAELLGITRGALQYKLNKFKNPAKAA